MMRLRFLYPLLMILLATTALAADNTAARPFAPVQDGFTTVADPVLPYAPDRLLVQMTPAAMKQISIASTKGAAIPRTGLARIDALTAGAGVRAIERPYRQPTNAKAASALGVDRWLMFHFDKAADLKVLAEQLKADANVAAVSFDWVAFPAAVPSDPIYPDQWGHDNTGQMLSYDWATYSHENGSPVGTPGFDAHAEEAWGQGYGSSSVIIAILDSGVDIDHPDLVGNLIAGYDFGSGDSNPDDDSSAPGHGTACAGVAAAVADNNLGVAGIAGGASIMPCKIADNQGSMYFSYIQDAIYYAADNGADVISMSLGAAISSDAATDAALQYAWNSGCIILAATGNENASTISYPAINQYVMGVGAASPCGDRKRSASNSAYVNPGNFTDPNDYTCDGERWWGSNYGSTSQDDSGAVDIIAPTILPTTDIGGSGGYASGDYDMWFNGTSCATPYAAGVAALVFSANPGFTNAEVWDAMTGTATDVINVESGAGWDRYSGYGLVNADAAIGGGTPVAPTAALSGTPTSGVFPLDVAFTDQSSGAPTSWSWSFGDGGTSTQQNPTHTYTAAGTYSVSLTVSNDVGSDAVTMTGYITVTSPPAPTAAFSGAPTSGSYPLDVAFTDQSTDGPTSWSWSFGDGGTSTLQNPTHTYAAVGTYSVSLTASNAYGSDTLTRTNFITVTEPGVTTFITASGETSILGTVSGTYAATAVSDGNNEVITEELYTGHPRKRYSYLEHQWNFSLPAGGAVTFHLEAARDNSADNDNMVFEYSTDGVNWLGLATVTSATEQSFAIDLGTLSGDVTVRAYDTDRNWDKVALDALYVDYMAFELGDVQPVAPTADFAGTPTSGVYPLAVQFTDLSTGDPTAWSWTFGDGGGSSAQNPGHTYTAAGTYTVTLVAGNAQGSDTATRTGYITVTEPGTGPTSVHVDAMVVGRQKSGPNYFGTCDVTIVDDEGNPVGGATVSASYTGPTSGTASAVTGSDGVASLAGSGMKKPTGEWCFTVTDVVAGLPYAPGDNVVTEACESGAVFNADSELQRPATLALLGNYPNPFNPMTSIKFSLPADSHVRLTVYDVRGQVVSRLVERVMGAGEHSVNWDARNHPSGVYFYRMETEGFSATQKMIMLK